MAPRQGSGPRARVRAAAAAAGILAAALAGACADGQSRVRVPPPPLTAQALLDELEERTFRFFWETANPQNGLVPDRYPTPSFSSVAAVGFGLTAYGIGAERGYVTREAARDRTLATLRFLRSAPQGPGAAGVAGHQGFFYHFLDLASGQRFQTVELSTVDTALLMAGVLFAQGYFDGPGPEETELRALADELYRRVDWRWAQARPPAIALGWTPEGGFLPYDWIGYSEAMLVVLLALGSPTFPVGPEAWPAWVAGYEGDWKESYGQTHLTFPPLFGHQYSHAWVDFRGLQDGYMREKGSDYFENSRRATYAQRAYAIANPGRWKGYGEDVWGLTACDGPADVELDYQGQRRAFRTYAARGPAYHDDGTLAPTAAAASIPFAPEIAIPAVMELRRLWGQHLYSTYGFLDSFNPSFEYAVPLRHGKVTPGLGWVAGDYLGIDQGPILLMLENHRSGLVWRVMGRSPYLRAGLRKAGFQGGWLEGP